MRTLLCFPLLSAVLLLSMPEPAAAQQEAPETAADTLILAPEAVATIDSTLATLYDVISGPAGQARNWDRFRALFVPGARLIPIARRESASPEALLLSVEDFIEHAGAAFQENGFYEREIARRTQRFGNLAHVFSTYASYRSAGAEEPFDRGINSIQLLHDGTRWWVVNIFWESERSGHAIPPEYLPDTTDAGY